MGYVRPEIRQRVYDEELSYIAEGINQPLSTEFQLKRVGDELVYFHNGQWRPYLASLVQAVAVYEQESKADRRKTFMLERAAEDLRIGYRLAGLMPGQKLRWKSSFPQKEQELYGQKLISDLGFQPDRQMGFLYEAEASADGSLLLHTMSVDNSDEEAFAAALAAPDMRAGYDAKMSQKHGGQFKAGRRPSESLSEENAWTTVSNCRDLLEDFYFTKIEELAGRTDMSRAELETAKKRLTYGVWAALKERIDHGALLNDQSAGDFGGYSYGSIQQEVDSAYSSFASRGEVLFGCGGAIRGEAATLQSSARDVFKSIFSRDEKVEMNCPFCGATQHGDPCASIIKCSECQAKVENGVVVSKGKGPKKSKAGSAKPRAETDWQKNRRRELEQKIRRSQAARVQNNPRTLKPAEPPRVKILI